MRYKLLHSDVMKVGEGSKVPREDSKVGKDLLLHHHCHPVISFYRHRSVAKDSSAIYGNAAWNIIIINHVSVVQPKLALNAYLACTFTTRTTEALRQSITFI